MESAREGNNWRKATQSKSILQKWRFVLDEEKFTDVAFYVGSDRERVACHRLVLKIHSDKLEELLSNDEEEYDLERLHPEAFRKFLRFLYTGDLQLNGKDAILMMEIAKEFEIPELSKRCGEYVLKDINNENAAFIFEKAKSLSHQELAQKAQEYILSNAEEVFKTFAFEQLSIENVIELVGSKEKNISEINAFQAVRKWALAECERSTIPGSGENVYHVAQTILELIDFKQFSAQEFTEYVGKTKSLPQSKLLDLLMELSIRGGKPEPTPAPRIVKKETKNKEQSSGQLIEKQSSTKKNTADIKSFVLDRYGSVISAAYPEANNGIYKVSFKTTKPILLQGVQLYFWQNKEDTSQKITVRLTDFDEKEEPFAEIEELCTYSDTDQYLQIQFTDHYQTDAEKWYTIIVLVKGAIRCYGAGGKKTYTVSCGNEDVSFELKNSKDVKGAAHLKGQIPKISFSLA